MPEKRPHVAISSRGLERRLEMALAAESIQVFSGLVSVSKVKGI